MTDKERIIKVDEARKKYGRPFITERPMKKPICASRQSLAIAKFSHQKRPFNV